MAIPRTAADGGGSLRGALLGVVLLGAGGLLAELLLLEHWDDPWQWAPLALLGAVLVLGAAAWRRPGARVLRLFRAAMLLCLAAGVAGVVLHYLGNAEFERERDPAVRGLALFWEAVRGATPALAPGAMAQLGVVGLLYAWRHPLLRATFDPNPPGES